MGADALTPEEKELLTRMDEKLTSIQTTIVTFSIFKDAATLALGILKEDNLPDRVSRLEKWATYRDGALALLLLLVGAGRLYDLFELIVKGG
jgi:hypothetical protein